MEFNDALKQFSSRIENLLPSIQTEEATKMSLVVPFFQLLGYDVFNPSEFCPEYIADVGIKKGEKVDYAILFDGRPSILIECKSCTEKLTKHSSQLFRYFGVTSAKFAILTNGVVYQFFTDLDETNKMDLVPFLEIDLLNIKENQLTALKKFSKNNFDIDKIFNDAESLKYSNLIKQYISKQIENPSEAFVKMIISEIYSGQKTQKVIDKFTPIIKKSFTQLFNELVNNRLTAAITKNDEQEELTEDTPVSKVVTTDDEIQAYLIVKGILAGTVELNDIAYRDTESYFGILYKDNNRKPICRINLDVKNKHIMIPDENKNFTRYNIDTLDDIYTYKNKLIEVAKRYL